MFSCLRDSDSRCDLLWKLCRSPVANSSVYFFGKWTAILIFVTIHLVIKSAVDVNHCTIWSTSTRLQFSTPSTSIFIALFITPLNKMPCNNKDKSYQLLANEITYIIILPCFNHEPCYLFTCFYFLLLFFVAYSSIFSMLGSPTYIIKCCYCYSAPW